MTSYFSSEHPLFLVTNRIYRAYPGGREIDKFRGLDDGFDDLRPEAWVGSTTRVCTISDPSSTVGLSEVYLDSERKVLLRDYILSDPQAILGANHVQKYGNDTGILVKLLDAQCQLGLQTHPDRSFAKKMFNSEYGKTESWYVLSLREDQLEKPYVLLGFKPGVTREKFQELFLEGKLSEMEECCHKIEVKPEEMYFVDAGVPHAIGPGCFVIEVQEPSDITVGATMMHVEDGKIIKHFDDEEGRQLFIERTMGCYHYNGKNYEENLSTYRVTPRVLYSDSQAKETLLLGEEQTPYFSVTRVDCSGRFKGRNTGTFSIAIVTKGKGFLSYEGGKVCVKQGDELFLPAGIKNLYWEADHCDLSVVFSYPPDAI